MSARRFCRDQVYVQADAHFRADAPELREFLMDHSDAAERFAEIVTLLLGNGIDQQRARAKAARLRDEFLADAVDSRWCARAAGVPFEPHLSEAV